MKTVRVLVVALLGYAAALAPGVSQASVHVTLPGISVRLPDPPLPIILPPGVSVREERVDYGPRYYREPEYRRPPPPRYYREGWYHDRWERRRYEDHRWHDHDHGWRR